MSAPVLVCFAVPQEAKPFQRLVRNRDDVRVLITGRLPDGAPVQEHAAFFVRGLRVYSASVIGAEPSPTAVEAFFSGLRFPA